MSATTVDAELNAAELNADTVHLTRHVLQRYCERRGGRTTEQYAKQAIRRLLARAKTRSRVQLSANHPPSRRFVAGGLTFIVTADCQTVLTFYERHK